MLDTIFKKIAWISHLLLALLPILTFATVPPPTFNQGKNQSIADFLLSAGPKSESLKLTNYTSSVMNIQNKMMLVAVYESEDGFDDKGNLCSSSQGKESANRQFAYAFIKKENSSLQYMRIPLTYYFDDGGSPTEVLAIFKAKFSSNSEPLLAILYRWNSSSAGGHLVMERLGEFYTVEVFKLEPNLVFSNVDSSIIKKLGGFEGLVVNEDRNTEKTEKAEAKNVIEIKKQLKKLGIK
jgi:hypothetical protein